MEAAAAVNGARAAAAAEGLVLVSSNNESGFKYMYVTRGLSR